MQSQLTKCKHVSAHRVIWPHTSMAADLLIQFGFKTSVLGLVIDSDRRNFIWLTDRRASQCWWTADGL